MPVGQFHGMRVHLLPAGPWRIGPDSGDRDRVDRIYHSDSFYSAVSHAMAQLGMLEEWLDATARAANPAVRFSSCFPFRNETLFVVPPRSLWPPPSPSAKVRWKGAQFVPLSVVDALVNGRPLSDDEWTVDPASECLVPAGERGPFRVSVRSSAAVDRTGAAVAPHSTACLEFAPGAGLWAVAAFSGDEARDRWRDPLQGALRLLADSGFGGERSRGWGRADEMRFTDAGVGIAPPASTGSETSGDTAWWMLSLFHPAESDLVDWQRGNYALTTRGGRIESQASWGDAKKPTRMVAEGSVIVAGTEPRGQAADVAPVGFPHPVYRAGFALAIPVPLPAAGRPVV
jgi:CRISPR type III-A-associated RAMP protein Csm4